MARPITRSRVAASVMPSNPKPMYSVSPVAMTAPSGKPAGVVRVKSFAFAALPAGWPGIDQPSRLVSNEVEPSPVETSMSSTKTPRPWVDQSLT